MVTKFYTFTYDADGRRVIRETVTDTIVYVGPHYEVRFEPGDKPEDLNGDCVVTVADIMLVVARWGMTSADPDWDPRYDFDGNEVIDIADVMQVAAHWKETCEELAETVKYYILGGKRVAMRKVPADPPGQVGTLYYLFSDHLGSSNLSYRADGQQTITQRYYPWGTIRSGPDNALPTDYIFTGQKLDESTGLMYYGARYYDPALGRFISADPIVPNPANPQDLNRYAYVRNNPLKYIDPTGHAVDPWGSGGNPPPAEPPPQQSSRDTARNLELLDAWIRWLLYNPFDYNECPDCVTVAALMEGREDHYNWLRSYTFVGGDVGQHIGSYIASNPVALVPVGMTVGAWASDELAAVRVEAPPAGERLGYTETPRDASSRAAQCLIDDVVQTELGNVRLSHYPRYDPAMPLDVYGRARRDTYTRVGPLAIQGGPRETLITIAHEEMHHRLWARGWLQSEWYVERVAQRFARLKGW